jgi:CubicO group peptidase (beta-lactamase class C family)
MPLPQLITAVVQEDSVRTDAETPVPWWSYAKTVLASAALILVAEGRLQLDEPVRGRLFTLRQLLQHRAGLRCYGTMRAYHSAVAEDEEPWPVKEMLRRVDAETLAYEPGHGWGYSNIGYLLVRNLIENEAGVPLGPALERLVFKPLGIAAVAVAREPVDLDATAWGNKRRYHPDWVYHGLLVGTASAAALFLHRLLAGDLLPPDLLSVMRDGHSVGGAIPGRPWKTASYGLGLMIGQGDPPGVYAGHTGGGPGSTSAVYQLAGDPAGANARCTGAAFAPVDDPGMVEARAMELAAHGSAHEVC